MDRDLQQAFAILGVKPGTATHVVRRRYKRLVRMWHPDRFHKNPQACAEATEKMRLINRAFQTIQGSAVMLAEAAASDAPPGRTSAVFLTPQERQQIIDAINARESLGQKFRASPLNCGASLMLVVLDLAYTIRNYLQGIPVPPTSVFAVLYSPVLLHYAWSDETQRRLFGWFWLVFFIIALPWFAVYMRGSL